MAVPDCTELLAWDWAYEVRSEMQIEALYLLYEEFIHNMVSNYSIILYYIIQSVKIIEHDNCFQL